MAGITVTREDLQEISGMPISAAKFTAVSNIVLGLIRSVYRQDITLATGRSADVLNAVFTSAALRIATNPQGARSLGLGSANVTFGGTDEDIANTGSLSTAERLALQSIKKPRPTSVPLVPYDDPSSALFNAPYSSTLTDTGDLTDPVLIAEELA